MSICEIYNEDGVKQFDADQVPLLLRRKILIDASLDVGRRTMGGNTSSRVTVWNSQTVTIDDPDAVIAFCGPMAAKVSYRSGNQWTIAYQRSGAEYHTLELFVFGTGSIGSSASIFQLYNEDGRLVLTGDDLPMRVVGGATYAIQNGDYTEPVVSLPGAKLAGILTASSQVRSEEDDPNEQSNDRVFISQTFIRAWGGSVTNTDIVYTTLRIPADSYDRYAFNTGSFVAVDVTGF